MDRENTPPHRPQRCLAACTTVASTAHHQMLAESVAKPIQPCALLRDTSTRQGYEVPYIFSFRCVSFTAPPGNDPQLQCRKASLILSRDLRTRNVRFAQVPTWRTFESISHRLDLFLTFMQYATDSHHVAWLQAGYWVSGGGTGKSPCLTSTPNMLHAASIDSRH